MSVPSQSWFNSNIGQGAFAATVGSPVGDGLKINIYVNPDFLNNASPAAVAAIFMHELLHAEILRSLWEADEDPALLQKNFPELYEIYINYPTPRKDWHHEAIANLYRQSIISVLSATEFNSSNNEALSWIGLYQSVSWKTLLNDERREEYWEFVLNEIKKGGCTE